MANFIKVGRPRIGLKKRQKQIKFFVDEDESKLFDDLVEILKKRRKINSRVDVFIYLIDREFHKQDKLRVIASHEKL